MKVSVTQENLAKALNHVLKATALKPNIPVLANILISTEKGKIKFSATNLEIAISAWIGGDIAEDGAITVNAKLFTEFVNQLKGNKVELIQTGQTLEVKSVDNSAQLFIIPADDFPTLPEETAEADLVVAAAEFQAAIFKTYITAATDQSRPVLTGILLESSQRKASLVGVDGFRLAKKTFKLDKGMAEDTKQIIPAKAMVELARIIADLADSKAVVNIFILKDKNQVLFKVNEVILSSRLIDGEFPNYQQIIPADKIVNFSVAKSDLADAVKIASIFSRNVLGNKTFFKILAEAKQLKLSAKVQDMGNNETFANLVSVEGEDFETAFNGKFMGDMLTTINGEEVIFEANGVTAPGVFKDPTDKDYLHIIMPMRVE